MFPRSMPGLLLELAFDFAGSFICMWTFYAVREYLLDMKKPGPPHFPACEILPPTYYVQDPEGKGLAYRYDPGRVAKPCGFGN